MKDVIIGGTISWLDIKDEEDIDGYKAGNKKDKRPFSPVYLPKGDDIENGVL